LHQTKPPQVIDGGCFLSAQIEKAECADTLWIL
jgi:hypothetical protein